MFRTLVANGQMEQKYLAARAMLEPKASPCHAALPGVSCWSWRGGCGCMVWQDGAGCWSLLTRPSCAAQGDAAMMGCSTARLAWVRHAGRPRSELMQGPLHLPALSPSSSAQCC